MEGTQLNSIAKTVFEEMTSFYSIPENEEAFEKWKKERDARRKRKTQQFNKELNNNRAETIHSCVGEF
ncbi:MAG: hypothetical protein PHY47_27420 [Lachnospiraceae bacterium]|nr:hypothetical protein [Lachnospiraceae bacterium]